MDDARIVHEQHRPGLCHGETHPAVARGFEHAGLPAAHAAPPDEHHRHEIHPVAVRPFRRRPADAACGIDAELMCLEVPATHRLQPREQVPERCEQLPEGGRAHDLRLDRLEPAQHPAVQRVVGRRLPVSTLRDRSEFPRTRGVDEAAVPTRTVVATITQVRIAR